MVDIILDQYQQQLATLTLKPSDGGRFEISIDGKLVFSGLDAGRFPGESEITKLVGDELGA